MARLRFNNLGDAKGLTNPITLTSNVTTVASWVLAPGFPTIASPDFAVVVVEQDTSNEEIVWVTAYTAGATSATVTRGQEGTTGIAHSSTRWIHGPTNGDFAPVVLMNSQPGNYTLALSDLGADVEINSATAATLTVPAHASVGFSVGSIINVRQAGAGQITVSPAVGVTLRTPNGAKTLAQWSTICLVQRVTDDWVLSGDSTT